MAKPRVVLQRVDTGEYKTGSYSWTKDLQKARVWKSEGTVQVRVWPTNLVTRKVPVRIEVVADALPEVN